MFDFLRNLFGKKAGASDSRIPKKAAKLHEKGRQLGSSGRHEEALAFFEDAARLAPEWPYPVYDAAYTYLLMGDSEQALKCYEKVEELEPRGFFTCDVALGILRGEKAGRFPEGTFLRYSQIEWAESPEEKLAMARALVEEVPRLAPAWWEIAKHSADHAEKKAAVEKGLASIPDRLTRDSLRFLYVSLLRDEGEEEEAQTLLRQLAESESTALVIRSFAQLSLQTGSEVRLGGNNSL